MVARRAAVAGGAALAAGDEVSAGGSAGETAERDSAAGDSVDTSACGAGGAPGTSSGKVCRTVAIVHYKAVMFRVRRGVPGRSAYRLRRESQASCASSGIPAERAFTGVARVRHFGPHLRVGFPQVRRWKDAPESTRALHPQSQGHWRQDQPPRRGSFTERPSLGLHLRP